MARDPADLALEQTFQEHFAKRASDLGAISSDQLSDEEFRQIANECLRANLGALYNQALTAEGHAVNPGLLAATYGASRYAQKHGVTIDPRTAAELARREFADVHGDPVKLAETALQNSMKVDAAFLEKFGNPHGE